ncbi:MAG: hypothetical protein COX07_02895 [Bacteroidetes bacterium CG23_combo_of_CG06-09_8_20_14_all_32_9]|nr:MAG: hypothetical protein COX07_02895 [Bacteroidetes bacterium CG23_combo_of_CG06-09_8_20_14_all_32_9]
MTDEKDVIWENLKGNENLKEYIFMTRAGYRHFFVLGKDLKDAEQNFMRIDEIKRCGFSLEDLPIRLEYDKEKCKDWKKEDFWEKNENHNTITA